MSARPINSVAWRGAEWTTWHIEYSDEQGRTLCMRRVPTDVACTRAWELKNKTCQGCLKVLDYETAKRLRLEEANG